MDANTQKLEQRVEALEDVCREVLQEIRSLRTEFKEFREEQARQWAEQSAHNKRIDAQLRQIGAPCLAWRAAWAA